MQVSVLVFGVLKEWLGAQQTSVEVPEGATVAELLSLLSEGRAADVLRGIAVSVNAEFALRDRVLKAGDEVGLLPPVSGGMDTVALTREPIEAEKLVAAPKSAADGAVVVFDGIVRDNSRGRQTLYLEYEGYEELALKQMRALAGEALTRFGVRRVEIVHRLGRLEIGETSVLIVVASAHRAQAFEACRWVIDTLKKTVPIWKKEIFVDGAVWAAGEPFPEGMAVDGAGASGDA